MVGKSWLSLSWLILGQLPGPKARQNAQARSRGLQELPSLVTTAGVHTPLLPNVDGIAKGCADRASSISCDRQRKSRCSGQWPSCSACTRRAQVCEYASSDSTVLLASAHNAASLGTHGDMTGVAATTPSQWYLTLPKLPIPKGRKMLTSDC